MSEYALSLAPCSSNSYLMRQASNPLPGLQLARIFSAADEWGWDPFALNDAANGRPLSALAFALLKVRPPGAARGYMGRVECAGVLMWGEMGVKGLA